MSYNTQIRVVAILLMCLYIGEYKHNGKCIVECDKAYFRPLEVDTLLGNSRKARKELNWKVKYNIKKLVNEMVSFELKN